MLRLSYKKTINKQEEEIELEDFYISSDLSFISGTTSEIHNLAVNESVWVKTNFYPEPVSLRVSGVDVVKRNGYILAPVDIPIQIEKYTDSSNEITRITPIRYVVYNGNTYFQDLSDKSKLNFKIDGLYYQCDYNNTFLSIIAKCYIDDNFVNVNGVEYQVIFSKNNNNISFKDYAGNAFIKPNNWNVENVTKKYDYIQKIQIGSKEPSFIDYISINRFGWAPYINYFGTRTFFSWHFDKNDDLLGFGLNIGGNFYTAFPEHEGDDYSFDDDVYNPLLYPVNEDGKTLLSIAGVDYEVFFEPKTINEGRRICIETKEEHLPVMFDDFLMATSGIYSERVSVWTLDDDSKFIIYNGLRYNVTKNLCDAVIIKGKEYQLTYQGDSAAPFVGMEASCRLDDGSILHFVVSEINEDEQTVRLLKRVVKNEDGSLSDAYTVVNDGEADSNISNYTSSNTYSVKCYDGVQMNDVALPVEYDYQEDVDDITILKDTYVNVSTNEEYKLIVEDVVGSNKLICRVDTNDMNIPSDVRNDYIDRAIENLTSNIPFTITKNYSVFGSVKLDATSWASQIRYSSGCTSVYEITEIKDNLSIYKLMGGMYLPITLTKTPEISLEQADSIMNSLYGEIEEQSNSPIIDMDKDIYVPVYFYGGKVNNIEKLEFNFHFRTRDLETWKIIEDEGTYIDNNKTGHEVQLSPNYQFCNWFSTDYYPYNMYNASGSSVFHNVVYLNKCMNLSDLLGFLYFTTNDVQEKRKKLSKSFLRLTYFDSKNSLNQNMLGTSTIYFDCDKYFETLYKENTKKYAYVDVAKSTQPKRFNDPFKFPGVKDGFEYNWKTKPTVLREVFNKATNKTTIGYYYNTSSDLKGENGVDRLDSHIEVTDMFGNKNSSEGFYAYILKYFANKNITQTIYMKAEFFHAGLGIKIPMVVPTDENKQAIKNWDTNNLSTFKKGYSLDEVYDRLYIPIEISYSKELRKFVYTISNYNGFLDAMRDGNTLKFNLFELKVKSN